MFRLRHALQSAIHRPLQHAHCFNFTVGLLGASLAYRYGDFTEHDGAWVYRSKPADARKDLPTWLQMDCKRAMKLLDLQSPLGAMGQSMVSELRKVANTCPSKRLDSQVLQREDSTCLWINMNL